MECRDFEEKFIQGFDNLSSIEDVEQLRVHRDSCRVCRSCAEWYETVKNLLDSEEQLDVPDDFTSLVMARVEALPTYKESPLRFMFRNYGTGLAIAASFAAMLLLSNPWSTSSPVAVRPTVNNELAWQAESVHQDMAIKLCSLHGDVQILTQGALRWRDAGDNVVLSYNDKVRTLSDSSAQLQYEDGTQVRLGSNSLVQLQQNALRVFHGNSWVHVTKKGTSFSTSTPNLVASVRGTIYSVGVKFDQRPYLDFLAEMSRKEKHLMTLSPEIYFRDFSLDTLVEIGNRESWTKLDSQVSVFESSVYVENSDSFDADQGVVLSEGYKLNYNGDQALTAVVPEELSHTDYVAWKMDVPEHLVGTATVSEVSEVSENTESSDNSAVSLGADSDSTPVNNPEVSPVDSFDYFNKQ